MEGTALHKRSAEEREEATPVAAGHPCTGWGNLPRKQTTVSAEGDRLRPQAAAPGGGKGALARRDSDRSGCGAWEHAVAGGEVPASVKISSSRASDHNHSRSSSRRAKTSAQVGYGP